jgi:hypothetical protein
MEIDNVVQIVIAVIVAIVGLGIVFTMVTDRTTIFTQTQDLLNYTVAPSNLALTKPTDFETLGTTNYIKNATSGTSITTLCNLTEVSNAPYIRCSVNSTAEKINISYKYYKNDYYDNGTTRTITNLLPILFGVGILALIVWGFVMKKD